MERKVIRMYSNFEEIQKKYPIGKPLQWAKEYTQKVFYYTEKDLEIYRQNYENVTITGENTCLVTSPKRVISEVEGYIFYEGEFRPAYQTWDGWQIWTEEDE